MKPQSVQRENIGSAQGTEKNSQLAVFREKSSFILSKKLFLYFLSVNLFHLSFVYVLCASAVLRTLGI
jgi:hypothetical protein